MGEPPRLSEILLNWEQPLIYFVTLCVKDRVHVLASEEIFTGIKGAISAIRRWNVLAGVIMPDHVHLIVTPTEDQSLSIGDFSVGFKRSLRKALPEQHWEWQRGCFDRLLRSDENLQNKWSYVEQNPIRTGLVSHVADWPYYLGSIAEQDSVGEAVSFPSNRFETLTASPTEEGAKAGNLTGSPTEDGSQGGKLTASPTGNNEQ